MVQESAAGRVDTVSCLEAGALHMGHATVEVTAAYSSTMPAGQDHPHQSTQEAASQGKEAGEATRGSGGAVQEDRKGNEAAAQHACQPVPVIEWWQEGRHGSLTAQGDAQCTPAADWMDFYRGGAGGRRLAQLAFPAQRNSAAQAAAAVPKAEHRAGRRAQLATVSHAQAGASGRGVWERVHKRQRGPEGAARSAQVGGYPGNPIRREGIRRARLRQDLERRAAEEAALLSYHFRASPVPQSSAQPRWATVTPSGGAW